MSRLLPPNSALPKTIWDDAQRRIVLPSGLLRSYQDSLRHHNLEAVANDRSAGDSPVGGLTYQEAAIHFAQAFESSAARAQLAFLGTSPQTTLTSNRLVAVTSGRNLCLLDAPCGSGASSLALLACVAELREQRVLPRLPLDVSLIGADISEHSRVFAQDILRRMEPWLWTQAITVQSTWLPWDATDELQTPPLIKAIHQAADPKAVLCLTANFSHFLARPDKFKLALPQLKEIWKHASMIRDQYGLAIWIEPQTNAATNKGGVIHQLIKFVTGWKLTRSDGAQNEYQTLCVDDATLSFLYGSPCGHIRLSVMDLAIQGAA
jgi:hypothetical protein